jgi:hypothetical protein
MRVQLLKVRAEQFARRKGLLLDCSLGTGCQGSVWSTIFHSQPGHSALKVHDREDTYLRERNVYLLLREYNVTTLANCRVPRLIDHDDELLALEMEIVSRPFCLDFGGAYLDYAPEFPEHVMEDVDRQHRELFEGDYAAMKAVLRELENLDIYMIDVHPGNISFR